MENYDHRSPAAKGMADRSRLSRSRHRTQSSTDTVDMYYPYNTVDDGTYLPDDLSEDEAAKEALEIAQEVLEKYQAQWTC